MPPKFLILLDLLYEQLFYEPDRLVIITETECAALKLTTADVQQNLIKMRNEGLVGVEKSWMDSVKSKKPTGNEKYLEKPKISVGLFEDTDKYNGILHWVLSVPLTPKFDEFYKSIHQPTAPISNNSSGIFYNPTTGIGWVHGKKFKFKDQKPNFILFGKLYERIGNRVTKEEIWNIIGHEGNAIAISEVVGELREKTGLSVDELVLNNNNVTLALKKLESPPATP